MSEGRVALAGRHFEASAYSEEYDLEDPEFATPLGIAVSAALGMINDSYMITLNGGPAKLFRSGMLTLRDVLLMNGYHYADMMGRTGANLTVTLNGERRFFRGGPGAPARMIRNGEEATLSDVVQAGDRIEFTPAVAGAAAACTLGELLGEGFAGAMVNGKGEGPGYALRQGDVVEALVQDVPQAPPEPPAPAPKPVLPAETPAPPARKPVLSAENLAPPARKPVLPAEDLAPPARKPVLPAENLASPVPAPLPKEEELPALPKKRERPLPPAEPPKREELAGQMEFGGGSPGVLQIQMNGGMLRLPPKPQGGEYYLMDVLQYAGLDFDNLEKPVELLVNGEAGQFTQVLKPLDDVVIQYQEG